MAIIYEWQSQKRGAVGGTAASDEPGAAARECAEGVGTAYPRAPALRKSGPPALEMSSPNV
eukprot:4932405-Prymnesium_polylepis.1